MNRIYDGKWHPVSYPPDREEFEDLIMTADDLYVGDDIEVEYMECLIYCDGAEIPAVGVYDFTNKNFMFAVAQFKELCRPLCWMSIPPRPKESEIC